MSKFPSIPQARRFLLIILSIAIYAVVSVLGVIGSLASVIALFDKDGRFAKLILDIDLTAIPYPVYPGFVLVGFGFGLVLSIAFGLYLLLRRNAVRKCAKYLHSIFHYGRDRSAQITHLLLSSASVDEATAHTIKALVVQHLHEVVADTKSIFDAITGKECSVTLKLIDGPKVVDSKTRLTVSNTERMDELTVRDLIRDKESRKDRGMNATYRCFQNRAYKEVLEQKGPHYRFISNNLSKLEFGFQNPRQDWLRFYNACIVVPIQHVDVPEKGGRRVIIGFLCVDNVGGGFDDRVCYNMLCSIADYLFGSLFIYFELTAKYK